MNKKFKRTLAGLTAFLMAFSAAAIPQVADKIGVSIVAGAAEYDENGPIFYEFNEDGTATLLYHDDNSVTNVTIPSKVTYQGIDYTVTTIGAGAFSDFTFLASVSVPDTVTEIEESAFWGCSALTSVTIPGSVKTIGDSAFMECNKLTNVTISEGVTTIGNSAFECCGLTSVTIPSSVRTIGDYAFADCSLKNMVIPEGVETIGDGAFEGNNKEDKSDISFSIPQSVTSIGNGVFTGYPLASITVAEGNENFSAEGAVLFNKDKTEIVAFSCGIDDKTYTIPETVTSIRPYAFRNCFLRVIEIPSGVTSIGDGAFSYSPQLSSISVAEGNENYYIDNGALIDKNNKKLVAYLRSNASTYVIPDRVKIIGKYSFGPNDSLTSITIPDGVITIDEGAFKMCRTLESITIPDSVKTIGKYAFNYCIKLKSVTLSKNLESIGFAAFSNCVELESIEIPASVKTIEDVAFCYCKKLSSVTLNDGLKSIGKQAFQGCESLSKIEIPGTVTSIGSRAFYECSGLTSLTIPNSVTTIEHEVFLDCSGLKTLTLPKKFENNDLEHYGINTKYTTVTFAEDPETDTYTLTLPKLPEGASLTVIRGENENLTAESTLNEGDEITVTVTAPEKQAIKSFTVTGAECSSDKAGEYTFTVGKANIKIDVEFQNIYKIDTENVPQHITLFKGETAVTADTTFVEGDKLTIKIEDGYDVFYAQVGDGVDADFDDGYRSLTYTFTGKEDNSAALKVSTTVWKAFKVDTENVPENITLIKRVMSGGQKSVTLTPVDSPVTGSTTFYKDNILVIKVDEECTVFGDVKVGEEKAAYDKEANEYTYTFKGSEANSNPIAVTADVKKNTCKVTFSGADVVKEDGTALESGDKVAEGTKLFISPSNPIVSDVVFKRGGYKVNGVALDKPESGDYTYTVKAEDTEIKIEEIVYYANDIEVTGLSDTYYVGDELEVVVNSETNKVTIKGATIKFVFEDGTKTDAYPLYESAVKNFDTSEPNKEMTFTIESGGVKKDIKVKVVAAVPTKIEVTSNFKKLYQKDEALDVSGGKITVTYDNGKTAVKDITADMVSGFDAEAVDGQKTLTITYTENEVSKTAEYTVTVSETELSVTGISASGYKTEYYVGDAFDASVGKITVTYNDGATTDEIGLAAAEIMGFDSSKAVDEQTITVKYGEKETTFTVKIIAATVSSAALTEPTKLNYKTGESLDLTGGKLTVVYSSGKIENIPLTDSRVKVTGFSSSTTGKQTITVTFGSITKTFDIYVTANSSSGGNTGGGGTGGSSGGSSSGGSGSSSTTTTPSIDGKETTWTDVASDIAKLPEGKTETIELNGGKTVPVEVVKAIATSNAEVTLKVDDVFSWTIDGSEIDPKDAAKAADFSITKTTVVADNTPRGTKGTSFSVKGTNVKSELNINFKATHAQEFANLYKKVDGKLVFVDNVKIDKNGAASGLEVSEKGEYVVMLGKYSDRSGDMDNDGVMNSKDALAVIKDFIGLEAGANPLVADVNGDGYVNSYDALQIIIDFLNIN